mgnify:CR=1 FL=1
MAYSNFEIAVLIAFAIFIIISILLTIKIVITLKSLNKLLAELRKDITPNLRKLSNTLDNVNAELGGVDKIINTISNLVNRIDLTTKLGQEMIVSPISKVAGILAGLQKAISKMKSGRDKE